MTTAGDGARVMVPFFTLQRQIAALQPEIDAAISSVLDSGWFVLGGQVAEFEAEFAAFCGAAYAVGVASGTDALHLALRAAGIAPGDEVVTTANAGVPGTCAIELAGARPRFVDVDPTTHNMSPGQLADTVTDRTRAILVVHLYGQPADMEPILSVARARGLIVIEDAAQAHGAEYAGRRVGTLGQLGCFSFYPTKNLGAFGDGGAVVTDDPELADRLRQLRQYGWKQQYYATLRGVNSRLDELQAAILRTKLPYLTDWVARRREIAALYAAGLANSALIPPLEAPGRRHAYHLFVVRSRQRDVLRAYLDEQGIGTAIHYPLPVHLQPAYRHLGYEPGSLPVTERQAGEVLSLPMFPELTAAEAETVVQAIRAF
jgi:dTDP-4-amino-4,6-dideoxygalactose transaminase